MVAAGRKVPIACPTHLRVLRDDLGLERKVNSTGKIIATNEKLLTVYALAEHHPFCGISKS